MTTPTPTPTPTQLHKFLEAYMSKEIDIALIEPFIKIWKDGTPKEKDTLEICVSIFSPLKLRGIPSIVKTFQSQTKTTTEKKIPKETLLEKEIEKLTNEIKWRNETIDELREKYVTLYRQTYVNVKKNNKIHG